MTRRQLQVPRKVARETGTTRRDIETAILRLTHRQVIEKAACGTGGRYFTKRHLLECVKRGPEWGFNRQLNERIVELPEDLKYPVLYCLVHEHRAFEPCEPHMRCVVVYSKKGDEFIVDVPMAFWHKLPVAA